MTSFAHDTRPGTDRPAARPTPAWTMAFAVAVPLACTVGTVAVMTWASSPTEGGRTIGDVITTALFAVWNLSPHLGLMALLVIIARRWPRGFVVALVASLGYAGFTAWNLYDFVTSDSSTAALLFVFLPVALWGGVIAVGALTWAVGQLAGRRTRRAHGHS